MNTKTIDDLANDPQAESDDQAVMTSFATSAPVDTEVARRVHERAQRIRDEIHRKHGVVDIAVPAIRELRDELPA